MATEVRAAASATFWEKLNGNREKYPPHVLQVAEGELTRFELLHPCSWEFDVSYNYVDWLTALPWGSYSEENLDLDRAKEILDEDHYGLNDLKETILEFIAVGILNGSSKGRIICLSGPPGVGKTSIARAIARALNRKFFKFSVGGLSDVAEIKGFRRSYVGAIPGKMVQCWRRVGTCNPLVLIDEIDKLGRGHSGNPASALLELLDPGQNADFLDYYLDVPIDLSKVMFVCTANDVSNIPIALLDRMEVIHVSHYTVDEKMHIARDHLLKNISEECGIKPEQAEVTDAALRVLIEKYCKEPGLRNLQKHVEKIYRKIALQLVRQGVAHAQNNTISTNNKPKDVKDEDTEKVQTVKTTKRKKGGRRMWTPVKRRKAAKVEKVLVDSSNLSHFVGEPVL
ncbi:hypothetical protein SLA2020_386260 [Shorea laevis]